MRSLNSGMKLVEPLNLFQVWRRRKKSLNHGVAFLNSQWKRKTILKNVQKALIRNPQKKLFLSSSKCIQMESFANDVF
jgi:hypothetical protein